MIFLIAVVFALPLSLAQFPGFGPRPIGGLGGLGGRGAFSGGSSLFPSGGERSYYVRGRLVCGIQGAQGARVSLWENRGTGGGQPNVYDEEVIDASGTISMKAEIRGSNFNGGGSFGNGNLFMTIIHNCDGNRQLNIALPPSYYNQGVVAIKTFDLGTINLEARYSEGDSGFIGGRGAGFGGGGRLGGF